MHDHRPDPNDLNRCSGTDQTEEESFSFIVLNDPHYVDDDCGAYLAQAFEQMLSGPQFDFVLVCGDIATAGGKSELAGFKRATEAFGKPTYVVMGNHDWTEGGSRDGWLEVYGEETINYRFDHKGWTFLGIDSTEGPEWQEVTMQQEAIDWLRRALADIPRTRPLVCFTHTPLGEGVELRLVNADSVLGLFSGYNLRHVFCGHLHGLTERRHGSAVLTTCRCLSRTRETHDGGDEKGYLLCRASDGAMAYEFVPFGPRG